MSTKIKLDWRKLESGSAPLPNDLVVFYYKLIDRPERFEMKIGTLFEAHEHKKLVWSPIYWAPLPEFEPPIE